jgi:hypothetical protein
MPAPIVHYGAMITCLHQGIAQPTVLSPRVSVSGQLVVTLATPYVVAGCSLATTSAPPCVSAQWITGATRVLASGNPVIIQSSQALCAPTSQGLNVSSTQTRVSAT